MQRVPQSGANQVVPQKGRMGESDRGGLRFDGRDGASRSSSSRGDSYSRFGRDRQWDGDRRHGGHDSHYGSYYGHGHGHGHGHGYHHGYAKHYYRPCYRGYRYGYGYGYPYWYRSAYIGIGLAYDPYWGGGYYGGYDSYYGSYGGYGGGYSVVSYETTPTPTYTTYNNTTVYESVPAQGYTQSYVNPDPVQYNEQSYVQSPNVISSPQAPSETYAAEPQPTSDATLTPPSSVQETQAAPQQEYKEPEAIREGHQHFGKGEFKDAQAAFLRGVLADGKDPFARLFYGMASVAVGDYTTAATSVRFALETAPDLIDEPIDLRQFYANAETLKSHLDGLTSWLQSRPDNVESRLMLAYLLFATGDADTADAELSRMDSGSAVDAQVRQLKSSIAKVKAQMSKAAPAGNQSQPQTPAPAIP